MLRGGPGARSRPRGGRRVPGHRARVAEKRSRSELAVDCRRSPRRALLGTNTGGRPPTSPSSSSAPRRADCGRPARRGRESSRGSRRTRLARARSGREGGHDRGRRRRARRARYPPARCCCGADIAALRACVPPSPGVNSAPWLASERPEDPGSSATTPTRSLPSARAGAARGRRHRGLGRGPAQLARSGWRGPGRARRDADGGPPDLGRGSPGTCAAECAPTTAGRLKVRRNLHRRLGLPGRHGRRRGRPRRLVSSAPWPPRRAVVDAGAGSGRRSVHGPRPRGHEGLVPAPRRACRRAPGHLGGPAGLRDSNKPIGAAYDARYFANAVVDLLDALEARPGALIGNSMGGRVAIEVGLSHAHRVERIALLAPSLAGCASAVAPMLPA